MRFRADSGDIFEIPDAQYSADVAAYEEAVEDDNERAMQHFESGATGWKFIVSE